MSDFPDQNFLEYVLKNLLDDLSELIITRELDSHGVLLTVKVSDRDMGKLIGKGGQTVKSLRLLLRLIATKSGEHINLKILDPRMV